MQRDLVGGGESANTASCAQGRTTSVLHPPMKMVPVGPEADLAGRADLQVRRLVPGAAFPYDCRILMLEPRRLRQSHVPPFAWA